MSGKQYSTSFGNIELKVSPAEMYAAATGIEEKVKNSNATFEWLLERVKNTSSYWQGDAAESERKRFDNQKENFQKLISNLTNYAEELRTITNIYEINENLTAEYAKGLQSGLLS